uniref:Stabilin 2 n=1 Tax=Sander lucioperca TaxID=283035 RepID=A0A8D0DEB8_SANLU
RTRTACHSCSISVMMSCPSGYRQTPGSTQQDCKYYIKTPSLRLPISGCSFECYKEAEMKSCCPGFWGPDCTECPDRADRPCSNRGLCYDGMGGNGTCSYFTGLRRCVHFFQCLWFPVCAECSCVHGLCNSGLNGDGSCICFSGYTGANCDQELPECAALSCPVNSRCMEEALTGQLVCQCRPGYQKSGDQCLSINPCLQRVCHVQASCVHTGPNQHLCACNRGYSGDGRVCMAIDPCQSGQGGCAAESARCVYDGPGTSHCECLPGFERLLDGACSLKDACRPDSCHKNANCTTAGPDRVQCTCLQGYLGNGKVCYGNIVQRLNELNTEPGGQWSGQLSSAITLLGPLVWQLQNLGPFTLFVPINKGFRGTSLKTLTADSSKAKYLCKMHLVAGVMPFDTLKKTDVFYTLTGKSAETDTSEGTKIRLHGSRKKGVILQSDVLASNGMIHVINKLMDSVAPTVESDSEVSRQLYPPSVSSTRLRLIHEGQILVNGAAVLEAAVEAKNGRLYVVDGVLTPPSIQPVLPHRCDVTENKIIKVTFGFSLSLPDPPLQRCGGGSALQIPLTGCSPLCNATVTTPACCQGFYGPDCSPCPGGYQTPCSGHGQCLDGIGGNGSCLCDQNFSGSRCQYCSSSSRHGPRCDSHCNCIHGQCDNRPDSDGRCKPDSCLPGFTGRFCDRMTAPCGTQPQFCHAHADCDFSQVGTARCVCKPGYQGNGITCVESDPCAPPLRGSCSLNAKCIRTGPGSHSCQCLSGWREDGDECQPINNCDGPDRGGCHANATCIYVGPGQSDCTCKSGYKGTGRDCEAVNQCVTENGGCHYLASCRLLSSRWTCVCDDGYVGNGRTCYGTVEQDSGLSWTLLDQNVTLLAPSSAAVAMMSSEDRSFWTAAGNLPSLVRNHIIPGIFPLSSLSSTSSLTCLLKTTLPVSTTNQVSPQTGGFTVIVCISLRLFVTFLYRFCSFVQDYNLTAEIEQAEEFTVFAPTDAAVTDYLNKMAATALDVNTTRYHVVASERLLKTDLQPGGYKQTLLGSSFQLAIFPRDGKLFVNGAQINTSNLLSGKGVIHGLSAVLLINRNRCDDLRYIKVMVQSAHTACSIYTRHTAVYILHTAEYILHILQCVQVRRCCGGFFGEHCEPCPGPEGAPCFGNGACSDGTNGTGVCRCYRGFNGTACETCESGKYGVHCDQECGCKNGLCNGGLNGDGTCECDVGWRGVLCDENVFCFFSSDSCVIRPSGSQCLCAAGFQGNGSFCQATDVCLADNGGCSLYAVCKRTRPGRRDCSCNSGYHGDGLVCVEINPCLEGNGGCHANAECVHVGPNKTSCSCSDGYSGDGQICKVIDLCRKKNGGCHQAASCNTTGPGVRSCRCNANYIGDGVTCRVKKTQMNSETLMKCLFCFQAVEISLKGRGPFTVFPPNIKFLKSVNDKEALGAVVRSHIVMCHTLLAADLSRPRNMTSLSGLVLTSRGGIFINEANVTFSDSVSINGIFHEIDKILFPPNVGQETQPLLDIFFNIVACLFVTFLSRFLLSLYFSILVVLSQDSGVMDLLKDDIYQPLTVFLPSDGAMASLPSEQRDFLFHRDNRAQLAEYLKYHILHGQKVRGIQIHLNKSCSMDCFWCEQGEIFVKDGKCRIVQRHLVFTGGIAYGIDCLLTPPSLGGRCDEHKTIDMTMSCGYCSSSGSRCPKESKLKVQETQKCDLPKFFITKNSGCRSICSVPIWQPKCCHGYYGRDCLVCPGGVGSPCGNHGNCDDGHLGNGTCTCDAGFGGVACELCSDGFYGASCKPCNCSEHASCDAGRKGSGSCFCEAGWTGERCQTPQAMDVCGTWNGGCAKGAKCSQRGETVTCSCPKGHTGDGFSCQPIDPCVAGDNGGCHEHATCTMTAPGKKKCTCKDNYVGDGLTCDAKQLPISRCLQDNGRCHQDAKCTDLHFEDAKLGVFHVRSGDGQYKLNFSAAQQACSAEGGRLATYNQLSYAQQGGMNMCSAGWLDGARVAYPTTYSNPNCGFGHVGIVDYGVRKEGESFDAFCFRMKEVTCECRPGFVGDGFSCTGNLLQVLQSTPRFSNFLTQILNCSAESESGRQFVQRLGNLTVQKTLFVPENSGLPGNQTLSQRDVDFHLSEGRALSLSELRNGSRIRTRVGSLSVLGVSDLLDPSALASRYINDRFVTDSDILASNGVIHVLQGPLQAPPPRQESRAAHKAGMGVGVVLLIVVVSAVVFVGFHFYRRSSNPFHFQYFKVSPSVPLQCQDDRLLGSE